MKLLIVLMLCAVAAAAPKVANEKVLVKDIVFPQEVSKDGERNILINALVRQLIAFVRRIINEGFPLFNIPPLDPLEMEYFHLDLPTGLVNLHLDLFDIYATGFGGFVMHKSVLNLRELSFDIDVSVPTIRISAGKYDLLGDIFNAIPLYGKGPVRFVIEDIRFQAKLYLKQSEDGKSVLLERVENASFLIPHFESDIHGAIGGGNIDLIVNAIIEEVMIDYINRFQGAISAVASHLIVDIANPILDQLDTWRFIAPLIPRIP